MSYDLTLFRVPDGTDASRAFEQMMERQENEIADIDAWMKRPISDAARAEMRRIAGVLKTWRPALEEFLPKSPLPWIELDDDELQVQFAVYDGTVGVTMPYFRDRAQEMMECATGCVQPLNTAARYSAYDPQLGRVVTVADLDEMVALYRGMDSKLPGILAQFPESLPTKKRPWWKLW
jgi:hypothetical protein